MKGYQIRKEIGKGNFGRTYLGFRSGTTGSGEDGTYAIKLALDTKMLHAVIHFFLFFSFLFFFSFSFFICF